MSEYLLELNNITKIFPGTKALDKVYLDVKYGEIHALCGENGAGKSTLMNIIGGVFPPTEGNIYFDGAILENIKPKEAQLAGIGFVHQELSLCPDVTVAENIFMGRLPKKNLMVDYKKLYSDSNKILKQFNVDFDSSTIVSSLTVSEQQVVEIAKSVSLNCKLLILDEPTSSLTDKETKYLFKVVKDLKDKGISILYISHRMAEIFEICDRVTVFKDGKYVKTMNTKDINSDDIIVSMVGRDLGQLYPSKSNCIEQSNNILEVFNISGDKFNDISFTLKKGEILGFAGLLGAGRSEVMRALCAIDPKKSATIILNGKKHFFKNYRDALNAGICYLTEDRKTQGLFLEMSIKNNMSSSNIKSVSNGIWIDNNKESILAKKYVEKLMVKIPGIEYKISSLSGGNQQKCLIGKWLSLDPKIVIMDEPTRGIDVGAKREIHSLLRQLSDNGVGVIIISSELPEVIGVADRVIVMHEGRITGFLDTNQMTEESIMRLASNNV